MIFELFDLPVVQVHGWSNALGEHLQPRTFRKDRSLRTEDTCSETQRPAQRTHHR